MIKMTNARRTRYQLLASVSAMALMPALWNDAKADDVDRPPVWIELGWHYEQVSGQSDPLAPPFTTSQPRPDFETVSPLSVQNIALFSYGAEGKISFQPSGSPWTFSAAVRYGRSHGRGETHKTTSPAVVTRYLGTHVFYFSQNHPRFFESSASTNETHIIADFQAARDVGLGMFGRNSSSGIGFGVRFAQLNSKPGASINEIPTYHIPKNAKYPFYHRTYSALPKAKSSFRGLGPSVSWNSSAPLAGDLQDGEVTLDWGVNAALLFGRQKAKLHHQTTTTYKKLDLLGPLYYRPKYVFSQTENRRDITRSKSVTVPNLGGSVGFSVRYSDVKFSAGYRANFFFGAIDGGWDSRHAITRGFYGPFASMSVGTGD